MADNFFYVYALKDPRITPVRPFYIGKGTGSRAFDHLITPDKTRKFAHIKKIIDDGFKPLVEVLLDNLTENQALRIEAEMIAAFGTVDSGGILMNSVIPAGLATKKRKDIIVPHGAVERAQLGLEFIKSAILELSKVNPNGVTNSEAASVLGLRSDYKGKQKDYLSYSVLGLLLREGKIERNQTTKKHFVKGLT